MSCADDNKGGLTQAGEKGLELFAEIYGEDMANGTRAILEKGEGFCPDQIRWTLEWAFGSVWTREGLSRKERSLVVLGMLVALRQSEEIRYHTRMGTANGLTRKELEEIVYTAIPYAGFPAAATAKTAMLDAFAAMYAEEQGD